MPALPHYERNDQIGDKAFTVYMCKLKQFLMTTTYCKTHHQNTNTSTITQKQSIAMCDVNIS